MPSTLDTDLRGKLHEFGGLMVYRASYFDPLTWKVVEEPPTFNEEAALNSPTPKTSHCSANMG